MERLSLWIPWEKNPTIIANTLKRFYKTIAVVIFIINMSYSRHGPVCAASTVCFMHYIDVEIYPSTITNMFTNDKEWNDMLVRDFIRKWFFLQ